MAAGIRGYRQIRAPTNRTAESVAYTGTLVGKEAAHYRLSIVAGWSVVLHGIWLDERIPLTSLMRSRWSALFFVYPSANGPFYWTKTKIRYRQLQEEWAGYKQIPAREESQERRKQEMEKRMKQMLVAGIAGMVCMGLVACDAEPAHEHTYTPTVVAATCENDGHTLFTCECGDSYQGEETAALGHEYGEWATVLEPTYDAEGKKEKKCLRCDARIDERIPKLLPHEHICVEETTQPTCTEKGVARQVCQDCGTVVSEEELAILGHSWSSWEVIKEATTTEIGSKTRSCKTCGETETASIPKVSQTPPPSTKPADPESSAKDPAADAEEIQFAGGNDSTILIDGKGFVTLLEAYKQGYIRIAIIDGLAYQVQTSNGVDYIKDANPKTGISYDLVSPIIYTYPDGTTGTELKDGATYEVRPGVFKVYKAPRDSVDRIIGSICSTCGQEVGGWPKAGYCLQWPYYRYCTCCGVYVADRTCHHCTEKEFASVFCDDCGKYYGNGTNNTCIGWFVDLECPQCGVLVPAHTCHTCAVQ